MAKYSIEVENPRGTKRLLNENHLSFRKAKYVLADLLLAEAEASPEERTERRFVGSTCRVLNWRGFGDAVQFRIDGRGYRIVKED